MGNPEKIINFRSLQNADFIEKVRLADQNYLNFSAGWLVEAESLFFLKNSKGYLNLGFNTFPAYYQSRTPGVDRQAIHKKIKSFQLYTYFLVDSPDLPFPQNQSLFFCLLFFCQHPAGDFTQKRREISSKYQFSFLVEFWRSFLADRQNDIDAGGDGEITVKNLKQFYTEYLAIGEPCGDSIDLEKTDEIKKGILIDDCHELIKNLHQILDENIFSQGDYKKLIDEICKLQTHISSLIK